MKTILSSLILSSVLLLSGLNTSSAQSSTWNVDPSHSQVRFSATHMMISEVEGSFKVFNGKAIAPGLDFANAQIEFTVDVASINTNNDMRDGHLKGDDFFNAEKFPKILFKSSSMKKIDEKTYELKGNLTIRDVTKAVSFKATKSGVVVDPYGNTRTAFKLSGALNRLDYNLKWNSMLEAGGAIVSDEILFNTAIELIKEK